VDGRKWAGIAATYEGTMDPMSDTRTATITFTDLVASTARAARAVAEQHFTRDHIRRE
jgi:hypothetical protein